ncbi:MAG: AAA family ATPase, partial [Candidatus Brockarchaeota archaeon]|nr:AAA family ATPase [Candidatus Brockarchaeota archaeon]
NGVSLSVQSDSAPPSDVTEKLTEELNAHLKFIRGIYLIHPRQVFRTYTYSYSPPVDYNKLIMTDQELANILATHSDVEEKVSTFIREIFGFDVISKSIPPSSTIRVESRQRAFRIPLALEGAGLNRLTYILTNLVIPPTTLLLVEEPEVHLHPKLLFALGRVLPKILKQENKQMIITTHNEHLLLALLIGLSEGLINKEDFVIYYLNKKELTAEVKKLEINEKGQVEGGLPGFFETDWETTEAYLKALAKGKD